MEGAARSTPPPVPFPPPHLCQGRPVRWVTLGLLHNLSGPCKNKTGSQGLGWAVAGFALSHLELNYLRSGAMRPSLVLSHPHKAAREPRSPHRVPPENTPQKVRLLEWQAEWACDAPSWCPPPPSPEAPGQAQRSQVTRPGTHSPQLSFHLAKTNRQLLHAYAGLGLAFPSPCSKGHS